MKFRNSEVPLVSRKDAERAAETGNMTRWQLLQYNTTCRWWERKEKLEARKRALRAANRRIRRQRGLSLKYA